MAFNSRFSSPTESLLRYLIALGIVVITLGLIAFFLNYAGKMGLPVELQVTISGVIILIMSYLSRHVFRDL